MILRELPAAVYVTASHLDRLAERSTCCAPLQQCAHLGVTLAHLGSHHLQELLKVDGSAAVLVNVCNHLLDLLLLGLKAKRPTGGQPPVSTQWGCAGSKR